VAVEYMRVAHDVGYLLIAFVIAHHPEIGLRTQATWVSFSERGWVNLCEHRRRRPVRRL